MPEPSPRHADELDNGPMAALVVGADDAWLTGWVEQQLASRLDGVEVAGDGDAAVASLAEDPGRRLVVLAQERPGVLPDDLPRRLLEANPDAQLLSVAGSWCEGELRTGTPWPGVERVYGHQFEASLTALVGDAPPTDPESTQPLISIHAADYDTSWALADSLAAMGFAAVRASSRWRSPPASGVAAAVWVGGQLDGLNAAKLARFCRRMRTTRTAVLAMLDFPRPDERRIAEEVGARAVLGKPWSLDQLSEALKGCLRAREADAGEAPFRRAA